MSSTPHTSPTAPPSRPAGSGVRFAAVELALWAALYGTYLVVRGFTIGSRDAALRHANAVLDLERSVGLLHEARIQNALSAFTGVLSAYYMLGFGPLLVAVLVWTARYRRPVYRDLRTTLLVSIAMATVVFVLFPTAPPRMVADLGIHDTVGLSAGHDTGSFLGVRFNPYAAMPSMHVGWSLLAGVYAVRAVRNRVGRTLFAAHPVLMTVAVVATGNHYLVDAVAGAAVASAALLVVNRGALARGLHPARPAASAARRRAPHTLALERRTP